MENFQSDVLSTYEILVSKINLLVKESLDRRTSGLLYRSGENLLSKEYDGCIFSKKKVDLETLLILCCFAANGLQGFESYIAYEVSSYLEKNLLFPELDALARLSSDKNKIPFLYILLSKTSVKNYQILLSRLNDATVVNRVLNHLSLKYISHRPPKRAVRHKGYRDHGSLRPNDRWLENFDFSFTELQNLKEQSIEKYQSEVDSIVRESGDWYLNQLNLKGDFEYESRRID